MIDRDGTIRLRAPQRYDVQAGPYGLITAANNRREASVARVRVDGVDVTSRCFAANDVEGWADCYVREENGDTVVERFEVRERGRRRFEWRVKRERLTGNVVIDFPRGLD